MYKRYILCTYLGVCVECAQEFVQIYFVFVFYIPWFVWTNTPPKLQLHWIYHNHNNNNLVHFSAPDFHSPNSTLLLVLLYHHHSRCMASADTGGIHVKIFATFRHSFMGRHKTKIFHILFAYHTMSSCLCELGLVFFILQQQQKELKFIRVADSLGDKLSDQALSGIF